MNNSVYLKIQLIEALLKEPSPFISNSVQKPYSELTELEKSMVRYNGSTYSIPSKEELGFVLEKFRRLLHK